VVAIKLTPFSFVLPNPAALPELALRASGVVAQMAWLAQGGKAAPAGALRILQRG
jgi:hypothetical protein